MKKLICTFIFALTAIFALAQELPRPGLVYKWDWSNANQSLSEFQPALFQKITTLRAIPLFGDLDLEGVAALDNDGQTIWSGFGLTKWFDVGTDLDLALTAGAIFAAKKPNGLFVGISLKF